jgi:hypothetical protein
VRSVQCTFEPKPAAASTDKRVGDLCRNDCQGVTRELLSVAPRPYTRKLGPLGGVEGGATMQETRAKNSGTHAPLDRLDVAGRASTAAVRVANAQWTEQTVWMWCHS